MRIRVLRKPGGEPACDIATAGGAAALDRQGRVSMFVKDIDVYGSSMMCASIGMSPTEARELAASLVQAADAAEGLAAK